MAEAGLPETIRETGRPDVDPLLAAIRAVLTARDLPSVMSEVRRAARRLVRADGATFALREGTLVHYADEDAILPLWKGRRFPIRACISGVAILTRESIVIEDIRVDRQALVCLCWMALGI